VYSRYEPGLAELLGDPIIHAVMERDGVRHEQMVEIIEAARTRLLKSTLPPRRAGSRRPQK
jgi:hypothetical protein